MLNQILEDMHLFMDVYQRNPTVIYVGRYSLRQLRDDKEAFKYFTINPNSGRICFMGLPIYVVDEAEYLHVA